MEHSSPKRTCNPKLEYYDDERDKIVFHETTPDLQDQDRFFLVSDRSCPMNPMVSDHITDCLYHLCRVTGDVGNAIQLKLR